MRVFSIITVGTLLAVVVSGGGIGGGYGHAGFFTHPRFQYSYGVNDKITGDFKTAHEHRDGAITKGSYSVLQPDGVLRTVNYIVDPIHGFQAQVLNKGIAHHVPGLYGKGARGGFGYGGIGGGHGFYG